MNYSCPVTLLFASVWLGDSKQAASRGRDEALAKRLVV